MEPGEPKPIAQSRFKWKNIQTNLKAGQLVLLKGDNRNLSEWNFTRVETTNPRAGGLVRVVDVTTNRESFRRSITLCPLPSKRILDNRPTEGQDVLDNFTWQ
ncbi:hypothetical protein NPIL_171811 [Nephila pilipes]|uniref:DUF5641 domain-containing protein n=1 Tax=Nephila pilipes TaxID=299642 RepID=A0A8X6T9W9_NEPPI|nr:hypothetical protein NPIL_171811 [Nephila pilipes]